MDFIQLRAGQLCGFTNVLVRAKGLENGERILQRHRPCGYQPNCICVGEGLAVASFPKEAVLLGPAGVVVDPVVAAGVEHDGEQEGCPAASCRMVTLSAVDNPPTYRTDRSSRYCLTSLPVEGFKTGSPTSGITLGFS